jgi:acyl carrier protein
MTNKEKYDKIFIDTFSLPEGALKEDLVYNTIPAWDSIGHMSMIAGIEDEFGITMETDDIINFGSYKKGFEILVKYKIEF